MSRAEHHRSKAEDLYAQSLAASEEGDKQYQEALKQPWWRPFHRLGCFDRSRTAYNEATSLAYKSSAEYYKAGTAYYQEAGL